jgi:hypothetical protein
MRFHTTLLQTGANTTGIEVPPEVVENLGKGKRPPVKVTVNRAYTYRNTIAVMGGVYMVGVSAEHRKGAGITGGDEIDVDIELDTEPREVNLPADLAAALEGDPKAKSFFEGLSYSNKRRHLLAIDDAKTAETRQRRIEKAAASLREGKA